MIGGTGAALSFIGGILFLLSLGMFKDAYLTPVNQSAASVAGLFGVIFCVTGIIFMGLGLYITKRWISKNFPKDSHGL